ncbi:MAG: hypothetical protein ACREHF_02050 [Rhizomicrobium sp.]
MPCIRITLPDGTVALAKVARAPQKKCSVCGDRAGLLCDYPVRGHTCDKPLCSNCAVHKADDIDWCPGHGPVPQLALVP